ncbi:hypothetical protein [uncultured Tateyamaria sp.]|uniref:hypothetical protein n=1 Tax=uncultured Tateyamaria sp. TaxID=455651 RepID=UPI00260AEAC5|nr:hypothetical protein [uncultured Tateyamaria sp.]
MNTTDSRNTSPKPLLAVIEGTGHQLNRVPTAYHEMCWSIDVLCDLKLAAERQGFEDVAMEIEVAYQRLKFLLTRNT